MIKYITILVLTISFALVGCKKSEAPTAESATDTVKAAPKNPPPPTSVQKPAVTQEQLAALEREKEEAIRMAEMQIKQAKADQQKKIDEVQARLEAETAARAVAEKQAAETRVRLDALVKSLEEAEKRQVELAAQSQSSSESRMAELAAAAEAVKKAQAEAGELRRQQEGLERQRQAAVAQQERIEAELRAELEKFKVIEDWDYSYAVRGAQYKRQPHEIISAKLKANPNRN